MPGAGVMFHGINFNNTVGCWLIGLPDFLLLLAVRAWAFCSNNQLGS